jgi:hypothetical protein
VEVLDLVGALAPALMAGLIPEPVAVVPVKRGRKPSGQKSPL